MDEPKDPNQKAIEDAIRQANPAQFPDFTEINQRLKAMAATNKTHTPRQEGPYIVCVSCGYRHTLSWIGTKKMLTGIDENGGWIIEDRF